MIDATTGERPSEITRDSIEGGDIHYVMCSASMWKYGGSSLHNIKFNFLFFFFLFILI